MKRINRLLVIASPNRYTREVLLGVHAYCRLHGNWEYRYEEVRGSSSLQLLRFTLQQWEPDGILTTLEGESTKRIVCQSRIPTVSFSGYITPSLPTVMADGVAAGKMAAQHLLNNGCRRFAFCSRTPELSPRLRCDGFVRELRRAGFGCQVFVDDFDGGRERDWVKNRRRMDQWLRSLPKPIGIFCCHDLRGQEMTWACHRAGLRVPEDVALVSVGNDDVFCRMCSPPLTSIEMDLQRIGYESARLAHALIRGRKPPRNPILVPPDRVEGRRSTDIVATDDPEIAGAIRFLRENAHQPITVKDLLEEVAISRRALERRFEKAIGRPPKAEITRIRIDRAKELLAESNLPGSDIAKQCGFRGQDKFSTAFRRECGMTPSEFRRRRRLG